MFKKFTDTLSGTLDTVKSYGSSMGIGQPGQDGATPTTGAAANTARPAASKISLNLPTLGRGDSTNAAVMASHNQSRQGRGPALGRAVETNETRITELHTLEDDMRVSSYHDINSYEQYKKVSDTGQMKQFDNTDYAPVPTSERMNGDGPKLVRSNTDEIIDQEFKAAQVNLDDVLDMAEYVDELTPVAPKKDDEEVKEKKKKKKNPYLMKCIRCIQDNRVKGGCVDPEEMLDAAGDNLVLKKVLNIIFLIVGSLLFIAVFVVIIYTTYGNVPTPAKKDIVGDMTTMPNNFTIPYYDYTVPPLDYGLKPWQEEQMAALQEGDGIRIQFIQASFDSLSKTSDGLG